MESWVMLIEVAVLQALALQCCIATSFLTRMRVA